MTEFSIFRNITNFVIFAPLGLKINQLNIYYQTSVYCSSKKGTFYEAYTTWDKTMMNFHGQSDVIFQDFGTLR